MFRRGWRWGILLSLGTALPLSACSWWSHSGPQEQVDPGIRTILLLPLSNQSEWPAAAAVVAETVKETLEKDKRYVVRSFSSSDPVGEVAWFLWNREVGSDTAKKGLRALCETYKADAALSVGIVSYHKALEEAPFVGSRSQLDYRSVWATHLSLKATLWGLRTEQIVWRQERTDRIYHGRTMGPSHRQETAARSVVRDLFKTFPVRSDR